ncbi:MAG: type II toxin-antitoxin system Phd/YefM family antitoxin [Alphaproteobacteria bacterium]
METQTSTTLRQNLSKTLDAVCQSHEPFLITRPDGDPVVMMSLQDFNGWQETLHLLKNPKNADFLYQSLRQVESGQIHRVEGDGV